MDIKQITLNGVTYDLKDQAARTALAACVNAGNYNSTDKLLEFKNGNTLLFSIDATAFIKDGMVDSIEVEDGYLIISFNTESGKEPISIPISDIFDASNYYTKEQMDVLLSGKEVKSNKVTSIGGGSTDTQYPSAKAVNTALGNKADKEDTYTKEEVDSMDDESVKSMQYDAESNSIVYEKNDGLTNVSLAEIQAKGENVATSYQKEMLDEIEWVAYCPSGYPNVGQSTVVEAADDSYSYWTKPMFLKAGMVVTMLPKNYGGVAICSCNSTFVVGQSITWKAQSNSSLTYTIVEDGYYTFGMNSTTSSLKMYVSADDAINDLDDKKVDKMADKGLSTEDYTTAEKSKLAALPTRAELEVAIDTKANKAVVNDIQTLIPGQASAQNQLADKKFVNSSIGTNTANYISNNGQPFASMAELEAYSGTITNNDYAFVVGTDGAGNTTYTRYKYNANTQTWAAEYVLNNSSFTAAQWATIQSGMTDEDVTKLRNLPFASGLPVAGRLTTEGFQFLNPYGTVLFTIPFADSTGGGLISLEYLSRFLDLGTKQELDEKFKKIPSDISRTATDATFVHREGDHLTPLFYLRQATTTLAGLMSVADKTKLNGLPDSASLLQMLGNKQDKLTPGNGISISNNTISSNVTFNYDSSTGVLNINTETVAPPTGGGVAE